MRRHGLSAGEASRIATDVPRGRRMAEPRLRRAAVDWARELLRREQVRLPRDPRTRRVVVVVLVLWVTTALCLLAFRIASGRGVDVTWVTVAFWFAVGVWVVRRRRNLRRAVELNDEPVSPDGS
ncbi:hypothetical protein [Geodermatophilus sp. DSM 45219]|uniref:hypothetical protein n=1 Tax=Geodermatophilus sp. DSM 45219 TaxID=1881103 RepID=UPI00088FF126|nr:hypothetical protein [Geodermatophilus sp. DSM 45219]SDN85895.1 hypothetical protein SAMN05428965_1972 [Geodermatophilus sp. DSM 45219]